MCKSKHTTCALALMMWLAWGCGSDATDDVNSSEQNSQAGEGPGGELMDPAGDGDGGGDGDGNIAAGGLTATCTSGSQESRGGCSSFVSPSSLEVIEFGPMGATPELNVTEANGETFTTTTDNALSAAICPGFANFFGEDPALTAQLLDTMDQDMSAYTVYRPAMMGDGETYPVIAWGNGTCAQPEGYGPLLRYIASHGFIVVSPNSRFVGGGVDIVKGIDLVFAMHQDSASVLYQRVNTDRVGVMGHSQGSGGANVAATMDDRIRAVILWNGGNAPARADIPYLAVSAELDIGGVTAAAMANALRGPGSYIFFHDSAGVGNIRGHLTLMMEPERVMDLALNFWRMTLLDDAEARSWFAGDSCKVCTPGTIPALKEYDFGAEGF